MIKGILYVLKGFLIWSCFCCLPFGFVIILSILDQPLLDWKILTLFVVIWLIALIVSNRWFEQNKKK